MSKLKIVLAGDVLELEGVTFTFEQANALVDKFAAARNAALQAQIDALTRRFKTANDTLEDVVQSATPAP